MGNRAENVPFEPERLYESGVVSFRKGGGLVELDLSSGQTVSFPEKKFKRVESGEIKFEEGDTVSFFRTVVGSHHPKAGDTCMKVFRGGKLIFLGDVSFDGLPADAKKTEISGRKQVHDPIGDETSGKPIRRYLK